MIHVLTLHHGLEWLPVWLKQAKKHAMLDYQVHLGVDYHDGDTDEAFEKIIKEHDEVETIMKNEAMEILENHRKVYKDENTWLALWDALLDRVVKSGTVKDDDVIIFCDSDTVFVGNWSGYVDVELFKVDFIIPHIKKFEWGYTPIHNFFVTTYKFWKEINGSWIPDLDWDNSYMEGGSKMRHIFEEDSGYTYTIMNLMNRFKYHDYFYLVFGQHPDKSLEGSDYSAIIYHHGLGTSAPIFWGDEQRAKEMNIDYDKILDMRKRLHKFMKDLVLEDPDMVACLLSWSRYSYDPQLAMGVGPRGESWEERSIVHKPKFVEE